MSAKIWIITAVVIVILLGAGGFMYFKGASKKPMAINTNVVKAEPTKSSGMFSSIQDIFTNKSLSLSCSFKDKDERTILSYIKNGQIRAVVAGGKSAKENGNIIVKSGTMYFWNGAEGMIAKFDPAQPQAGANGGQAAQGQAALSDLEKYKESCRPAVISDGLFNPPADVKFQDVSETMKELPQDGTNNQATPSINPADLQKMMQQYGQH